MRIPYFIAAGFAASLALPVLAFATTAHAQARPDVDIIAMSTFVEDNCIGLRTNKRNVRDEFERAGGFPGWTDNPFHQTLVREQVNTLRGDVPRSCNKLWHLFGDSGAIQPGLIEETDIALPPAK